MRRVEKVADDVKDTLHAGVGVILGAVALIVAVVALLVAVRR